MPRDLRPINSLTDTEEMQLRRLLDKRAQSLPEAQEARDLERALERKLQEKRDRMAREEVRLSKSARRVARRYRCCFRRNFQAGAEWSCVSVCK
jgi:hypothetical protein